MEPIQINVTVKLDDATQAFLSSLFHGTAQPAAAPAPVEQPKPKPAAPVEQPKPAAPVEQPKPAAPVEQPKPAPAKPAEQPKPTALVEQPKPAALAQPSITIDSLRELAMTKMNAHRVEIKQKLTELGTPSITKLDASKYQEMFEFLRNLS